MLPSRARIIAGIALLAVAALGCEDPAHPRVRSIPRGDPTPPPDTTPAATREPGVLPTQNPTLVFTVQPTPTQVGSTITPAVQVTVLDGAGHVDLADTTIVTISLKTATTGLLRGTTQLRTVHGVATFSDLAVLATAPNWSLVANAPGHPYRRSHQFSVVAEPGS